ncbi:O-antigen ligase family protein [Sporosarcina sp. E16_3]|uniref:O-antigen ligase family protein n=1 Tax=Sporosarcina sp. E16_3 TaxID=2789293 RepID=UPI001A91821B|nr:O-antigen ligase family protein [Sporosarcina sp. E16_3]MBO0602546.1 O-antigen ligase family protein [Sporosarcina sp. E16_3]
MLNIDYRGKKSNGINKKISTLIISVIFVLMLIGTLNATSTKLSVLGLFSLSLTTGLAMLYLVLHFTVSKKVNKTHVILISISAAFMGVSLIGLFGNIQKSGLINLIQFALCIGFTLFLSLINWDRYKILTLGKIASVFILIHFFIWASTGFESAFSSIYANPNLIGPYMLFMLFFIIWARWHSNYSFFYNTVFILGALTMIGSDARSSLLSGLIAFFTYLSWRFLAESKIRFSLFILIVLLFILALIFFYSQLPTWKHYLYFESIMLEYTGKSLMSGRQFLWGPILPVIGEHPWFGYGPGVQAGDVMFVNHSLHNLFLQITLQNGYLGLTLFLALLISIWMIFWGARKDRTVKLVGAFFIATLIHQTFEIALIQNQLSIGLMQWFIISIGISQVLYDPKRVQDNQLITFHTHK